MSAATHLNRFSDGEGEDKTFARIAADLTQRGYSVLPSALPQPVCDDLLAQLENSQTADFNRATVGRGSDQTLNGFVRRDKIHWIEPSNGPNHWLDWAGRLQAYLNRRLYMGLFSFESHFAIYRPGDFYQKHLDAFKGQSNRVLSVVTYLNQNWAPDQGGELVLYDPDSDCPMLRVTPALGTLVVFLSEEIPHEVLTARRSRYSVAGWFRVNGSTTNQADPPQ